MIKKIVKSQKGGILVLVIVFVAVLSIAAVSFIDSAGNLYQFTKGLFIADKAYISAESATNLWADHIKRIFDKDKYFAINVPIQSGADWKKLYVADVLDKVRKETDFAIKMNALGGMETFQVDFMRFEIVSATEGSDSTLGSCIIANVGFVSTTSKLDSDNINLDSRVAQNNRAYVQREIKVPYFKPLSLNFALGGLGDVLVTGGGTANIYGNIYNFGSFPAKLKTPNQYFYGGVMVSGSSGPTISPTTLNVHGNVLTRSFLRTGRYHNGQNITEDRSEINVARDVIAQGIQTFSAGNKIYIYRNAFTFDDIELNGEGANSSRTAAIGSIIAVNGSFIGLSDGLDANSFHDASSAMLNSAGLHGGLIQYSLNSKSRIVVNGDVIIPGRAFKTENNGNISMLIESAGLIYPSSSIFPSLPAYRNTYNGSPIDSNNYYKYLFDNNSSNGGSKSGYLNLIQLQAPIDLNNYNLFNSIDPNNASNKFTQWKTTISSLIPPANNLNNNYSGASQPNSLHGFAADIVGANDRMYVDNLYLSSNMPASLPDLTKNLYQIVAPTTLPNKFTLDTFTASEIAEVYKYTIGSGQEGIKLMNDGEEKDPDVFYGGKISNKTGLSIKDGVKTFWLNYWKPKGVKDQGTYFEVGWKYYYEALFPYLKPDFSLNDTKTNHKYYINMMFERVSNLFTKDGQYSSRLNELKKIFYNRLDKLGKRTFPGNVANPSLDYDWQYSAGEVGETFNRLNALSTNANIIKYNGANAETLSANVDPNNPKLILVNDPQKDLIVNTTFYGIIFSKGRVILNNGADVKGAIFACGRKLGSSNKSTIDLEATSNLPYFNRFMNLSDYEANALDKGDTAGILIQPGGGTVTVDLYYGDWNDAEFNDIFGAYKARDNLLEKFKAKGIILDQIF